MSKTPSAPFFVGTLGADLVGQAVFTSVDNMWTYMGLRGLTLAAALITPWVGRVPMRGLPEAGIQAHPISARITRVPNVAAGG